MLFEFSSHSLEQIKLRSITKDVVELVINEPDEIIIEEDNQHVFQKIIENYLCRVFVNTNKTPSIIKTIHRTSKINKYL